MKTSDFSRFAVGIYATIAILAGCGGSHSPMTPGTLGQNAAATLHGSVPISSVRSDSELSGEMLTSTKVRSHCHGKKSVSSDFHAHGSASGPFPGTFTASGSAKSYYSDGGTSLDERFTITSGSEEISGHIEYRFLPPLAFRQLFRNPNSVSCSKHILSFDFPKVPYKVKKHPHQDGRASATLENGSFSESFKKIGHRQPLT
jgi:hypothetical protein